MQFSTGKVKFSHSLYQGPELIPVYRQSAGGDFWQSACRWLFKSSPVIGCHYFPCTRPAVTFPADERHHSLTSTKLYTAWWQRHIGINNCSKVVTQLCPGGNWTHHLLIASLTACRYACSIGHHFMSYKLLWTYSQSASTGWLLLCVKEQEVMTTDNSRPLRPRAK